MANPRTYTVFGATGGTGQQLVRQALDAGHRVRAVVRDPVRLPLSHERLEVITAEVTDPEPLRPAVRGSHAVLSALGAPNNRAAGIASRGTRMMLQAVEAEAADAPRRFIAVSAAPVGPTPQGESLLGRVALPFVRRSLRAVYRDLALMEDAIRDSGAAWTVVRPPKLTDRPLTGSNRRNLGGAVPRSLTLPRADLAHAMLTMVDEEETVQQVVGVAS